MTVPQKRPGLRRRAQARPAPNAGAHRWGGAGLSRGCSSPPRMPARSAHCASHVIFTQNVLKPEMHQNLKVTAAPTEAAASPSAGPRQGVSCQPRFPVSQPPPHLPGSAVQRHFPETEARVTGGRSCDQHHGAGLPRKGTLQPLLRLAWTTPARPPASYRLPAPGPLRPPPPSGARAPRSPPPAQPAAGPRAAAAGSGSPAGPRGPVRLPPSGPAPPAGRPSPP